MGGSGAGGAPARKPVELALELVAADGRTSGEDERSVPMQQSGTDEIADGVLDSVARQSVVGWIALLPNDLFDRALTRVGEEQKPKD